jgi:Fur family ferric uptake transcriptional regulator
VARRARPAGPPRSVGLLGVTSSPHVPRLAFRDIDDAVAALRERGLRLSTARRLLLEALFAAEGPVSAERLAGTLDMEPTSVYRNLETLEEHGLVGHVHLGHGPGLYVLTGEGEHEYLYCERCGNVRSVTPAQLDPIRAQLEDLFGYQTRFTHFPLVGLCERCAQRREAHAGAAAAEGASATRRHEHPHDQPHTHEHHHGREAHEHPHTTHDHNHTEHAHEHSHGDYIHSHPHLHQEGLEEQHEHGH